MTASLTPTVSPISLLLFNRESRVPIVVRSDGGEYTRRISRKLKEKGVPVYSTRERAVKAA